MAARKNTAPDPTDSIASPKTLPPLWTLYRVRWTFLTRLCGSVPADPELIKAWIAAREPRVKPAGSLSIEEVNEEVLASIERGEGEADQSYSMLVFQRHGGGLVERAATTKAHIKDCAFQLRRIYIGKIQGELTLDNRVKNGVYPDKRVYWIPILREDGTPVIEADGAYDKPIHVRGPRGEQLSALKRFEYIEPPSMIEFTLQVLGNSVSEIDLHRVFEYGGTHGYAGERSDGEGRYDYTIERLDTESERATVAHG
jgi:hypothetical protein